MAQHRSPPNFGLLKKKKLPILDTCVDMVFGVAMIAAIRIIVAYSNSSSDSPFKKFLSSNTFGPRFIKVKTIASHFEFSMCNEVQKAVGGIIASYWVRLDRCK